MNFILFTKYIGSPFSLGTMRSKVNVLFFIIIVFIFSALFYAGYWLGQVQKLELGGGSIFKSDKKILKELQLKVVDNARDSQLRLDALMQNLYALKSHVKRLDRLGGKLLLIAKVENGEIGFNKIPETKRAMRFSKSLNGVQQYFANLSNFEKKLIQREERLQVIEAQVMYSKLEKKLLAKGRPIRKGRKTSNYGYRIHPKTKVRRFHHGADFAAKEGTPIYAVADGIVSFSEKRAGYGNIVEITHGKFSTRYAHNLRNIVGIGDRVRKGQLIALVGKTGVATGFHVHFEVLNRRGKTTNPISFIKDKRVYNRKILN